MNLQQVKQRFGIIGNAPKLNRALEIAVQVAPTDVSVLITGESGTGKEVMPQVIHHLSHRKHGEYIAVNCGAIPEGTIDSELFGHEKGSFTGASDARKGYFEVANGGTIFLDEVADLPLQTQVRLLRVLETGEFIRVGSSKVHKTNVRVVAATNLNVQKAIEEGKFREDLFYRLNSVPIHLPPLRDRGIDIHLLFRKFSADFAEKYRMPGIQLTDEAVELLINYYWPGNIRQLKNTTEQIAIIENERLIDAETLTKYLPDAGNRQFPMVIKAQQPGGENISEREILYKVLFDMRNELQELKAMVLEMAKHPDLDFREQAAKFAHTDYEPLNIIAPANRVNAPSPPVYRDEVIDHHEEVEESLLLNDVEKDLIVKALQKHNNRRKNAARELGISERTLYRKIKEYNIS
ncbi:MAG TPA: sigma-54 dependent transcriptional regulator [Luteibaculaceae bacterium]|nr:sigma-54 dependent transcriptional regulator [Luteibaculaceae bacterium]